METLSQALSPRLSLRTEAGIRLSGMLALPESRYEELIWEIEHNPLVQELMAPQPLGPPPLWRRPDERWAFDHSRWTSLDERLASAPQEAPLELLAEQKKAARLIERIGRESFERFFLYNEEFLNPAAIAAACHLIEKDCFAIRQFVDSYLARCPSAGPQLAPQRSPARALKIVARIDKTAAGFSLAFLSSHYARGRYEINRSALRAFQQRRR
ncbi:MAG: hypothetical protein AAB091_04695, partial [Elusimicrobiota bacterium]